ncbi:hypothetical protein OPQ81_011100 [Rhizoctonia solani]|nr:hypothetical protein OPQ81_011100 [Rhizoctonia solani]
MPGPSSPARQRKIAAAKVLKPPPYQPSVSLPMLWLPGELSPKGRVWWNKYIGKTFLEWKKHCGNKQGVKGKLRRLFQKDWWDAIHPKVQVSNEDKLWYFDKTIIGTQIYAYINNNSV